MNEPIQQPVVVAKFVCTYKQPPPREGDYPQVKVSLNAVGPRYDGKNMVWDENSDNKNFWEASPAGELHLYIKNANAAERFVQGQEYYLNFVPAGKPNP